MQQNPQSQKLMRLWVPRIMKLQPWITTGTAITLTNSASNSNREVNLEDVYQVTESLQDHLLWQLNLTPFSNRDKDIAVAFIDAINESGFIVEDLHEATSHLNADFQDDQIETDELQAVLKRLQQFDPPGIFARDFKSVF